jgi:hypothetical protein
MVATLGGGGAAAGVAFCNLADEFDFTSTLFAVDTDDSVDTAGSAWSAGLLGFDATSVVEGVFASEYPTLPTLSVLSTLSVSSGFLSRLEFAAVIGVRCDPGVLGGFACAPVFLPVTLPVAFVWAAAVSSLSSGVASDADVADPVDVAEAGDLGPVDVAEPFAEAAGPEESGAPPVLAAPVDDSDVFEETGSAHATPWPVNTAAPTPRATASPPIRPMYLEEFMTSPRVGDDCPAARYARWASHVRQNGEFVMKVVMKVGTTLGTNPNPGPLTTSTT